MSTRSQLLYRWLRRETISIFHVVAFVGDRIDASLRRHIYLDRTCQQSIQDCISRFDQLDHRIDWAFNKTSFVSNQNSIDNLAVRIFFLRQCSGLERHMIFIFIVRFIIKASQQVDYIVEGALSEMLVGGFEASSDPFVLPPFQITSHSRILESQSISSLAKIIEKTTKIYVIKQVYYEIIINEESNDIQLTS